jgi:type III restriction enzyme
VRLGDGATVADGTTLVLEIKGQETEQDRAKHQAAERWVSAVTNWGEMGRWAFATCRDPQTLLGMLQRMVEAEEEVSA